MIYPFLLVLLGLASCTLGLVERGWALLAVWFGADCLALGIAHYAGIHRIYGKRPDGSLPLWGWVALLPLILYATAVWRLLRLLIPESAQHIITDQLVIGRRLLPSEAGHDFDNFVDLTAEFAEPAALRRTGAYRSFPILDGGAPAPAALAETLAGLRPGKTFIHCAQGHGRSGLFALALLLKSGRVRTVEEGLRLLRAVRPGIRLSRRQRACIEAFARDFCCPGGK